MLQHNGKKINIHKNFKALKQIVFIGLIDYMRQRCQNKEKMNRRNITKNLTINTTTKVNRNKLLKRLERNIGKMERKSLKSERFIGDFQAYFSFCIF